MNHPASNDADSQGVQGLLSDRGAMDRAGMALLLLLFALGAWKALLAGSLGLFGDEAFYWLEGRHLAWAYGDLPPLTAWLIRAGTELIGESYLGVRSLAIVAGTALPWLVYRLALRYVSRTRAAVGGALSLGLPLCMSMGLLALPDVWLNALWVMLLIHCTRALDGESRQWLWAGVVGALGLLTHYRFAVLLLAVAVGLLASAHGRRQLRTRGPWVALGLVGLGAAPSVWFNLKHQFSALAFQLADRHPWSFQPEGLVQPLVQALVATPGMYLLLLVAAVIVVGRARGADGRWVLLAWAGVMPWAFYLLMAPFTDQDRTSFHWPLAAYLPLCVALPEATIVVRRWLASRLSPGVAGMLVYAMIGLGAMASLALMVQLGLAARDPQWRAPVRVLRADNLFAWKQAAAVLWALEESRGRGQRLIADNFMLAAELSFESGRREPVYSLDHPRNAKHGRARQLRSWNLDASGLQGPWQHGWLVVEESATKLAQRPQWLRRVCERFGRAELVADRSFYGGDKRFLYYYVERSGAGLCDLPAFAYLDRPVSGERLRAEVEVSGWAFEDQFGVARVDVLLDGVPLGSAQYGSARPEVAAFFQGSTDPNHPLVGFRMRFDSTTLDDGRHWLSLRTIAVDGGVRDFPPIPVTVDNAL